MEQLPLYVDVLFELTVALTIYLFYRASHSSRAFLAVAIMWVALQLFLSFSGFYHLSKDNPPNLPLLALPPTLFIIILFLSKRGRLFIDKLSLADLTLVHSVGFFVELVFYFLFIYKYIPKSMTFEGRNFDILSGVTAPLVYYFGFVKKSLSKNTLIAWNLACLLLLVNAVAQAVLSLPPGFQRFGIKQPDRALGLFPFILLPACVVPIVLFAHLASIRQLMKQMPVKRLAA